MFAHWAVICKTSVVGTGDVIITMSVR